MKFDYNFSCARAPVPAMSLALGKLGSPYLVVLWVRTAVGAFGIRSEFLGPVRIERQGDRARERERDSCFEKRKRLSGRELYL